MCERLREWKNPSVSPVRYDRFRPVRYRRYCARSASASDISIEELGENMRETFSSIDENSSGRNAVFYGDKAIDRSPCGTGTSARMAQLHAKGKLEVGEEYVHESFIGSKFIGRVKEETTLAGKKAIIPSIQGWAKVYGYNTIIIDDEDDPYAHGFQVI